MAGRAGRSPARRWTNQQGELVARLADSKPKETLLAEERRQWEAQQDENTSQEATEGERLNAQLAELDAERQTFEQQRQQWQAEQDEAQRQSDEQRNEIVAAAAGRQLEADRRQWEQQRAELARTAELLPLPEPVAEAEHLDEAACTGTAVPDALRRCTGRSGRGFPPRRRQV